MQTLCDKGDNNLIWENLFAKLNPSLNRSFCQRPKNTNLSEDHERTRKGLRK